MKAVQLPPLYVVIRQWSCSLSNRHKQFWAGFCMQDSLTQDHPRPWAVRLWLGIEWFFPTPKTRYKRRGILWITSNAECSMNALAKSFTRKLFLLVEECLLHRLAPTNKHDPERPLPIHYLYLNNPKLTAITEVKHFRYTYNESLISRIKNKTIS